MKPSSGAGTEPPAIGKEEGGRGERKSGGTDGRHSGRRSGGPCSAPRHGGSTGAGAVQRHRGDAPGPERYPAARPCGPSPPPPSLDAIFSLRPRPLGAVKSAIFSRGLRWPLASAPSPACLSPAPSCADTRKEAVGWEAAPHPVARRHIHLRGWNGAVGRGRGGGCARAADMGDWSGLWWSACVSGPQL